MKQGDGPQATLDDIVSRLEDRAEDAFEAQLRAELGTRDRGWLLEALVQVTMRDRHLQAGPQRQLARHAQHVESVADRRRRLDRIRGLGLTEAKLRQTLEGYRALDRDRLVTDGYLIDPPHKGKEALGHQHRSEAGENLLRDARDLFYALLFCDERQGVRLPRQRRDFLTVTLPSAKADTLERFMLAVTETRAQGTWLDPEGVSDDIGAANTILQVEFGDSSADLVCDGLMAVLGLLNNLEVNEEILYARIEGIERSTLVQ